MKGLLERERSNKPFRKGDIFVYAFLLILSVGCLLPFVLQEKNKPETVYFSKNGETVLIYDFETDAFSSAWESVSVTEIEGGYRVILEEEEARNIFFIDKYGRKVTVTETNCSARGDCLYMTIEKKGDAILCVPHGILVYADERNNKKMIIG